MGEIATLFPKLPSVDKVLSHDGAAALYEDYAREAVAGACREVIDGLRAGIADGRISDEAPLAVEAVIDQVRARLELMARPRLGKVVNATGVVLHTNLGRALLSDKAADAVNRVATNAAPLEFDMGSGKRGERDSVVVDHIRALTGAEAATIVNNNAAAVFLVLNALAEGREVVVSRGELVEIGGSFRIPDVMTKSGAILREVGTTNRTHDHDYTRAVGPNTSMFLKVHASNYRIIGFTAEVGLRRMKELAVETSTDENEVVVFEDLGAGALVDLAQWELPAEPIVADSIAAGADVVTFSGDKLLGGPQCGLIVGRQDLIDRIRRNPLKRALRCDKMTLAALESTLAAYRFSPDFAREIPTLRALTRPLDELEVIGARAVELLSAELGEAFAVEMIDSAAQAGSGSQPEVTIPSRAVAVTSEVHTPDKIARLFRRASPPVIGRIEDGRFLLDLRCIETADDLVPRGRDLGST